MIIRLLLLAILIIVYSKDNTTYGQSKPDITIKASQFKIKETQKKIYYRLMISNIGNASCTINQAFTLTCFLLADSAGHNRPPLFAGKTFIRESLVLQPGTSRELISDYSFDYSSLDMLEALPYCKIEISHSMVNAELNTRNNATVQEHGLPMKKGDGLVSQPAITAATENPKVVDLAFQISEVTSKLISEAGNENQYLEYSYTATIKNIGTAKAVIDQIKPIKLRYWKPTSCTDTIGMTIFEKAENQLIQLVLEPGQSISLPMRKVRQKSGVRAVLLAELVYDGLEKNKRNNFACLEKL